MGIKERREMDHCIRRKHLTIMVQVASICWVDPVYEIVGVYFSVTLELIDDTRSKECYDLFTNAVTAAVVDA